MHTEEKTTISPEEAESGFDAKDGPTSNSAEEDVALKIVNDSYIGTISAAEERRVVRKIDWIIMPMLIVTFMIQYIDKVILNGAAQVGIIQDLDLYTVQGINPHTNEPIINLKRFSNVTMIFYWGCLAALLPASYLAQRLPIAKFLGCTVIVWGAVVMLTVLCTGYRGFLAARFFLGVTECAVAPGFSIVIAMWWKKAEQPLRFSIWYTSCGFGSLVGSLLVYGIGHIHGSLQQWKYQYLILGAATILWGLFLVVTLPDNQTTARFFNDREKIVSVERMRSEQTGIENKKFKLYQVKDALTDPKTWMMFFTTFSIHFVNGSVSGFGSIIVNSFGYPHLKSILLVGATGACVVVTLIIAGAIGTYTQNTRTIVMAVVEVPVIIGSILVWKMNWSTGRGGAITGFILLGCFAAAYMMMLALAGANTAGHTKKAFTSGLIWCAWGISNGVAPLTIKSQEVHEHYPTCFKATIATACLSIFGSLSLRAYLQWQNSVRDRKFGRVDTAAALTAAFSDQTDVENSFFRYSL
ncbi:hypothetical protein LTR84_011505 [Exophiala bonariae]|uniref:Major facilitator superfamily (MFS) profile domain-containing protein n=1 Tax=Exophiala bonariae TaxID=1690606 RepID=A0AAV9NG70_9EURO|nr:hypothetical protein LTR84_011505 [Exophiala bonariae]